MVKIPGKPFDLRRRIAEKIIRFLGDGIGGLKKTVSLIIIKPNGVKRR
jgi:hypothetical protein